MRYSRLPGVVFLLAGTSLSLGAAAPASVEADSGSAERCVAMANQVFGSDVKITSATHLDASAATPRSGPNGFGAQAALPAHCRIEGVVDERKGAGGKTYEIKFAIALSDRWSGRFLLQGGGLNGSVGQPVGPVASDGMPALARGCAVISDDSGHEGAVFDASFTADQRAALDFAEASVLTTAKLGKRITEAYYGEQIAHSSTT